MIKETYVTRTRETAVMITNTAVESVKQKDIVKTGIRLYQDGLIGVAGAIGPYDEKALMEKAGTHLRFKIPYPYEPTGNVIAEQSLSSSLLRDEDLVAEVNALLEVLRERYSDFRFSNQVSTIERTVTLVNDRNLNLSYRDRFFLLGVLIKEKASGNIIDAACGTISRRYDRRECLELFDEVCEAYRNPMPLPKKKRLPVLFSTSEILPLEKFISDLNGRSFGAGSSVFSTRLGQKVFDPKFTLYQSLDPEENYSPFFDAEGTVQPDFRYPLVENGVIMAPYTDKKTAHLYGYPLTGSAGAAYDEVPALGFQGFKVKESGKTTRDLLGGEPGIFVYIASGGDFTPDGAFSTPVQLSFLYDGEKLIGRLPELSISSDIYTMFGSGFIGVGKERLGPMSSDHLMVLEMDVEKI